MPSSEILMLLLLISLDVIPIRLMLDWPVCEVVKRRLRRRPVQITGCYTHKCSREAAVRLMSTTLITQNTRIIHRPNLLQVVAF